MVVMMVPNIIVTLTIIIMTINITLIIVIEFVLVGYSDHTVSRNSQ